MRHLFAKKTTVRGRLVWAFHAVMSERGAAVLFLSLAYAGCSRRTSPARPHLNVRNPSERSRRRGGAYFPMNDLEDERRRLAFVSRTRQKARARVPHGNRPTISIWPPMSSSPAPKASDRQPLTGPTWTTTTSLALEGVLAIFGRPRLNRQSNPGRCDVCRT